MSDRITAEQIAELGHHYDCFAARDLPYRDEVDRPHEVYLAYAFPALLAKVRRLTEERDEARRDLCFAPQCNLECGEYTTREQARLRAVRFYGAAEADRLFPEKGARDG